MVQSTDQHSSFHFFIDFFSFYLKTCTDYRMVSTLTDKINNIQTFDLFNTLSHNPTYYSKLIIYIYICLKMNRKSQDIKKSPSLLTDNFEGKPSHLSIMKSYQHQMHKANDDPSDFEGVIEIYNQFSIAWSRNNILQSLGSSISSVGNTISQHRTFPK